MAKLRFTNAARADLVEIAAYIRRSGGSRALASGFTAQLRQRCAKLAALPGELGRSRDELALELRSVANKNYVIFFRYQSDVLEVVNILEGHRDLAAYFGDDEPS